MPPIVRGNWSESLNQANSSLIGKDFGYKYPGGMDLRPGSKLHDRIVSYVMERAQDAYNTISKRFPTWNSIDEVLTAYIHLSDYEKAIKKENRNKPVSVMIPHSYAALETILAYNTKAFLSDTLFQYEGVGPEDTIPAKLLELVVAQQTSRFKTALDIHTGFRDGLAYGIHGSVVRWEEKYGKRPVKNEVDIYSTMGTPLGKKVTKDNEPTLLFEGSRVQPIDPYRLLLDPSVSAHRVQDGEFFGWFEFISLNKLLHQESSSDDMFNVKYLKLQRGGSTYTSIFSSDKSKREKEGSSKDSMTTSNNIPAVTMYMEIIPRELGLVSEDKINNKDGELPEKWTFTVANDTILIKCSPLNLNHNSFPVAINSPDYDGYSCSPVSRMEMNYGLQEVLNYVFNSHIENVRKAIHDMFIVDPSLVSMTDLQSPGPGKYIRLRRSAWGRGVDNAVKQLAVSDITRNNLADAASVMDMMQRAWATPDAAMGFMRGGSERRSAAEFSGTFGAHISRLEHIAKITSLQYMYDLGYFHASHTQQLMSQDIYVRAVGEWPQVLMEEYGRDGTIPDRVLVSPFDIIADFDVIVKDSSSTFPEAGSLQFWSQILPVLLGDKSLFQVFDIVRIFKHVARISGSKNVNDFVVRGGNVQASLLANEEVLKERDKGNAVPISEISGTGEPI